MLCCCKRRGPDPSTSGPVAATGSAPIPPTQHVAPIFQQAIAEPLSPEEILKRENLIAAQLFLRGTVFNLAEKEYYSQSRRDAREKATFLLHDPYGPRKIMSVIAASAAAAPSLGTSAGKLRVQRTLLGLRFPFVFPLVCAEYLSEKKRLVAVRILSQDPTMRHVIYGKHTSEMDEAGSIGSPLALQHVSAYGRQILEAICFLRHKGISCCHIHAGNIFVDEDTVTCKLSDFENGIVGVAPLLSPFIKLASKKIRETHAAASIDPDVLCFYHVVHEMTLGYAPGGSPNSNDALRIPQTAPRAVQKLLKDILKGRILTVFDLLDHPMFAEAEIPDHISSFTSYRAKLSSAVNNNGGVGAAAKPAAHDEEEEVSA